jgi:hypothetical protein
MFEGFNLFQGSEKLNAFAYILGTLFLGIIGYVSGYALGKLLISFDKEMKFMKREINANCKKFM